MKNLSSILLLGLIAFSLFFVGLIAGKTSTPRERIERTVDTVTVLRIDTVKIPEPKPVYITQVRTDTVIIEVAGKTVYVPVPIDSYVFKDSLYRIEMEGFNVQAKSIEIYPRTLTRTITQNVERTVTRKKRFGIGISAGYGISQEGFTPYVGIGLQYNLISF